jgi:hypothetical protein
MSAQPSYLTITPAMATQWLDRNKLNRKLDENRIKQYAEDIAAGRWIETGENIKVALNGNLIDGQHRLVACVRANRPFRSWVMVHLPNNAITAIDTGKSRKPGDILALAGEKNTAALAAVLTGINAYLVGRIEPNLAQGMPASSNKRMALLEEFPEVRESVVATAWKAAFRTPLSVLHFFGTKVNPEATSDFLEKVRTGSDLSDGDPVLLYRNHLYNHYGARGGMQSLSGYRLAIGVKALNDHMSGASRQQLRWKYPSESFPLLNGCKFFGSRGEND